MDPPDLLGSGEVRNRPRDSQNPMEAARGKPHRCSSIGKELATGLVGRGRLLQHLAIRLGVCPDTGPVIAVRLDAPGASYSLRHFAAPLRRRRKGQVRRRDGLDVHVQVDAIE